MRWPRIRLAALLLILPPSGTLGWTENLIIGSEWMSFGSLRLEVPEGWVLELESSEAPSGTAYAITPPGGREFLLLVTPIADLNPSEEDRCEWARSVTEDSRDKALSIAVETEVEVQERRAKGTCLLFFSVTDKTVTDPTTEDFKYMTQGMVVSGHVLATFTILTNIADPPEGDRALQMLQTARHLGGPEDLLAAASAATRLAHPDQDWALLVDLSGFQLEAPQPYRAGTCVRFAGESDEPDLMVTIFFEPTDRVNDPKTYRERYRKDVLGRKKMAGVRVRRRNIRESERDEMAVLRYTNIFPKDGSHQEGVNAFLVRDGVWIDIHLSSSEDEAMADELFDDFLGSVRFVDRQLEVLGRAADVRRQQVASYPKGGEAMAFWFISNSGPAEIDDPSAADIADFRSNSLETIMYYADKGEAIVVSHRNRSILIDGGGGVKRWNDPLGNALANRIADGSLRAILATHPHLDHTNFYRALLSDNNRSIFSKNALYFDNTTPKAVSHWNRMIDIREDLPFAGVDVNDDPSKDTDQRVQLGSPVQIRLLRGSSKAKKPRAQAYWSVFMIVKIRGAALLFTGDVHKSYERAMLDRVHAIAPQTHVLKITHHGSHTGTSKELVAKLNPGIAISSSNDDAKHDLSSAAVKSINDNSNAVIFSTFDKSRTGRPRNDIILRTDGKPWTVDDEAGIIVEVVTRDHVLPRT